MQEKWYAIGMQVEFILKKWFTKWFFFFFKKNKWTIRDQKECKRSCFFSKVLIVLII